MARTIVFIFTLLVSIAFAADEPVETHTKLDAATSTALMTWANHLGYKKASLLITSPADVTEIPHLVCETRFDENVASKSYDCTIITGYVRYHEGLSSGKIKTFVELLEKTSVPSKDVGGGNHSWELTDVKCSQTRKGGLFHHAQYACEGTAITETATNTTTNSGGPTS